MSDQIMRVGWSWAMLPYEVIAANTIEDLDVRVYAYLVYRAGRKASSFPGVRTMARDLSKSEATIRRSLARLIKDHWLLRLRRVGRSSLSFVFDSRARYAQFESAIVERRARDKVLTAKALDQLISELSDQLTDEPTISSNMSSSISSDMSSLNESQINESQSNKNQPKEGARKKTARAKPEPDPLAASEEIQFIRDVIKRYPQKETYQRCIDALRAARARGLTDDQIRALYTDWLTVSSNRGSLTWLVEWAAIGRNQSKRTGPAKEISNAEHNQHAATLMGD